MEQFVFFGNKLTYFLAELDERVYDIRVYLPSLNIELDVNYLCLA